MRSCCPLGHHTGGHRISISLGVGADDDDVGPRRSRLLVLASGTCPNDNTYAHHNRSTTTRTSSSHYTHLTPPSHSATGRTSPRRPPAPPRIIIAQASSGRYTPQQNMLPRTPLVMLLLAVLAVLLQLLPGRAANPKVPHLHKGVLEVRRQRRCVPSASKCGNDRRPGSRMNVDAPSLPFFLYRNTSSRCPRSTSTATP